MCEWPKVINQVIKRNFVNMNSKSRTNSHVFTEQGVAMLASVLKTEMASKVSINITRHLYIWEDIFLVT